ncbi:hypothetical protein Glove_134g179 [Diversispora epigaea]|uniref:V-type proton ATPase subunit E n=1 Tax=Diversispora epigaea TaxID=1348612 RepID=A0A397IWW9_9GLOM|nr:hypothetical protein Glove_134g179 [Diversispora epigaea]
MSTSRALSEEEVINEMNKMVAFIKQEAMEKAVEIKSKAEEEFNIEKAKLVRQETINIETAFQRKIKQVEVQKKITQSNNINKSRLRVLQARQELLEELFNEARTRLKKVSQYGDLLKDLILQGLFQLLDENVTIFVRRCDLNVAKEAVDSAQKEFIKSTGLSVKIDIEDGNFLPDDSAGGVVLTSHFGRIRIDNTLEERLRLAQEEMLPEIRLLLFGHSPNRKYFN